MKSVLKQIVDDARKINWGLLLFLLLFLNVKLVVKIAAVILISIWHFRSVSFKSILKQRTLYFYFSMIVIGLINFLLNLKNYLPHYIFTMSLGIGIWLLAAIASYHLFNIIQKEKIEKLYATITAFFILHISVIFLNLLWIMIKCRTFNPYTYKGFNQKYYISTGDHIFGITYDSPVVTALISAFALLYFLYRRHFILSLVAAAGMALIGSNLTNIFLILVLLFCFVFRTDRTQKSFIVLQLSIFAIFLAKISPRDNEYVGRVLYNITGKIYDLPKKNESLDFIKVQPDSLLDPFERKRKLAQLYIDSLSTLRAEMNVVSPMTQSIPKILHRDTAASNNPFYRFTESDITAARINRYNLFLEENYTSIQKDSLADTYDWKKPGKWIGYLELFHFLKNHPSNLLTGEGIGNFSSRTAFKVTALGIAGSYPQKLSYISPVFRLNHLYIYLNYHSQNQMKHAAANTPDSTYGQLLGEYGIAGIIVFILFYLCCFIARLRRLTFGLPLLLMLMAAFSVEYLFEQLSIVVLFEALLFLDMKSLNGQKEADV